MTDATEQLLAPDQDSCSAAIDAPPERPASQDATRGDEGVAMPVPDHLRSLVKPSRLSLAIAREVIRKLAEVKTLREQIKILLKTISPDEQVNETVLRTVAATWYAKFLAQAPSDQHRESFLYEIGSRWGESRAETKWGKSDLRQLLELVSKKATDNPSHDARLAADCALLFVLRSRYPRIALNEAFDRYTSGSLK